MNKKTTKLGKIFKVGLTFPPARPELGDQMLPPLGEEALLATHQHSQVLREQLVKTGGLPPLGRGKILRILLQFTLVSTYQKFLQKTIKKLKFSLHALAADLNQIFTIFQKF